MLVVGYVVAPVVVPIRMRMFRRRTVHTAVLTDQSVCWNFLKRWMLFASMIR